MNHHHNCPEAPAFDYANDGWPRDFDIRIEVAEQREVLGQSQQRFNPITVGSPVWRTSEYDF